MSLAVLSLGEVTGEVILVAAVHAADVTLKRLVVTMATHMHGVEHVIPEIRLAMRAEEQRLSVDPHWGRFRTQDRVRVRLLRGRSQSMIFDLPFVAIRRLLGRTGRQVVAAVLLLIGCQLRKREGFVLGDEQRFGFGLRGGHVGQAAEFVSAAAMVRQVTPVVTAERTELALIRLLARVRAHMCLQLSLVRRGERTELTTVRLLSCVCAHVLDQSGLPLAGVTAVTTPELSVSRPLKSVRVQTHLDRRQVIHLTVFRLTHTCLQIFATFLPVHRRRQRVHVMRLLSEILLKVSHKVQRLRLHLVHRPTGTCCRFHALEPHLH